MSDLPSIPLAAKNKGMRVDLPGVVVRISEFWEELRSIYFDDDGEDLRPEPEEVSCFVEDHVADLPVDVLNELLRLLKLAAQTCYTGGDPTVVDQFFQLWCLDDHRPDGSDWSLGARVRQLESERDAAIAEADALRAEVARLRPLRALFDHAIATDQFLTVEWHGPSSPNGATVYVDYAEVAEGGFDETIAAACDRLGVDHG